MQFQSKLTLEQIKDCETNILSTFADFCDKNNLRYYLSYGTLIGAVRHQGFIPWDDDIDVEMPRSDYNKIMEILSQQNNLITENIELKTPFSANYQYPFAKVIDNTTFVQEITMKKKYKTSVWIDIFPLDNIPDSPQEAKQFINKAKKISKYYFYTIERKYSGKDLIGKIKFNTIRLLLTPVYKIINQKQRINRFAQKYSSQNTQRFTELIANNYAEFSIRDNSFLAQTKLQFENRMYTTFADYDTFLKNYYGDYMKLPPEEQRVLAHSLTAYKK
jgi:lipopolysaccharide cholinephosphotransferase